MRNAAMNAVGTRQDAAAANAAHQQQQTQQPMQPQRLAQQVGPPAALDLSGQQKPHQQQAQAQQQQAVPQAQQQQVLAAVLAPQQQVLAKGLEKSEVIHIDDDTDLQGTMITRSVKPTTTFRGIFEVTPQLKIKVWSYPATKQAALPTLKKRRKATGDGDGDGDGDAAMGGISTNRRYVLQDDNDQEIPPEQLVKAFKYGKDLVPLPEADIANTKVKGEKGMWLLAFAPRSKVKLHYLMTNAEAIVADCKDPEPSTTMLAALVTAMREVKDKEGRVVEHVAVVRWVKRANDPPRLFALFAHADELSGVHCLYSVRLPFNEDLRRIPFSALRGSARLQPSAEHLDATRAFVAALDIPKYKQAMGKVRKEEGDVEGPEAAVVVPAAPIDATLVFNPVVQHFYRCVHHKALHGGADGGSSSLAPPDKRDLAKGLHPDPRLWSLAAAAVERMRDAFKVPLVEGKAKRKQPDGGGAAGDAAAGRDGVVIKVEDDASSKKARVDGAAGAALAFPFAGAHAKEGAFDTTNPEGHFELLWKRDDLDAHENAIKEMAKHVIDIVDNCPGERFYAKVVLCLRKLRSFCDAARNDEPDLVEDTNSSFCDAARNDEPDLFNEAFEQLADKYRSRTDISFWAYLTKQGIEKIKIGDAEEEEPAPAPVAAAPAAASIPDDDLDDDLLDEAD